MFLYAIVLWTVCATSGCTSTRQVDLGGPEAAVSIRAINALSARKKAKIQFANRSRTVARRLLLAPDSTSWIESAGGEARYVVSTHTLWRIRFTHPGQGALEGLALGALAGLAGAFGMLLSSQQRFEDAERGVQQLVPLGSLVGLLFGTLRGSRQSYVLTPAPLRLPPVVAGVEQDVLEKKPPAAEDSLVVEEPAVTEKPPAAEDSLVVEEPAIVEAAQPDSVDTAPETEVPAPPEQATPEPTRFDREKASWTVVVASRTERASAETIALRYREQLRRTGHRVDVIEGARNGITYYRVAVGQFETAAAARTAREELAAEIPEDAWLLRLQAGQ